MDINGVKEEKTNCLLQLSAYPQIVHYAMKFKKSFQEIGKTSQDAVQNVIQNVDHPIQMKSIHVNP